MGKPIVPIVNCLNCGLYEAIKHETLGFLPCKRCQNLTHLVPQKQIELTTQEIKDSRKEFEPDIVQPWREGELSKEYLQRHGTKYIKATPEEIKNARNVWGGYYIDN